MSWKVKIERFSTFGHAWCETCDKVRPDSTRERCRQHADGNPGHRVRFVVEQVTLYTRDAPVPP